MEFESLIELVDSVNRHLGGFCRDFQYKRKELLRKGRAASASKLFHYQDPDRDWAINPGGGTEAQYHLNFHGDSIGYGIGFNTQYVPFANDLSTVDYMRPYADSFLSQPQLLENLESNGYDFIIGALADLKNLQHDKYILLGKTIPVTANNNRFQVDDSEFESMIEELKGIVYETYKSILTNINRSNMKSMVYQEIINTLTHKGQIILQGPPGTGKTYSAKDLAEQLIFGRVSVNKRDQKNALENSGQFQLVQFHPSYSYEDFVRGISAQTNGKDIEYKTENKVFAKFAKKAHINLVDSSRPGVEIVIENWLDEKFHAFCGHVQANIEQNGNHELTPSVAITGIEEDAFRYNGHDWQNRHGALMPFEFLKRGFLAGVTNIAGFRALPNLSITARDHRATYFVNLINQLREFINDDIPNPKNSEPPAKKDYVFVIDEINRANLPSVLGELIYALEYRGEAIDSMYAINGDASFIVPENLYIIGTMNTADRSVAHIDYAIRRRFAFVDVLPDDEPIPLDEGKVLFGLVKRLFYRENGAKSEYLAPDFDPKDVQLGHSYFIVNSLDKLRLNLEYEILPILMEYIKDGILRESARDFIEENLIDFGS